MTPTHCNHRPPCPGCPRLGETGLDEEVARSVDALADRLGAELLPLLEGRVEGYRVRARLALRGRPGRPLLGLFQEGSHRLADIPRCPIHHPAINRAGTALRQALRESRSDFYREASGRGCFRYAQFVVERSSGRVQLTLVLNDSDYRPAVEVADLLTAGEPELFHSIWMNENRSAGNAIMGARFELLCGEPWLVEDFAGARLHFHPGSFGQANLDLAEEMTRRIHEAIPDGRRLLEYHAGVGAIGLGIRDRMSIYTVNEVAPFGLAGLRRGLDHAGAEALVLEGPAASHLDALSRADVVICDPPRKGLEPELLGGLTAQAPEQLILLHCGFEAAVRDLEALHQGGLKVERILPVALIPFTDHVELVSFLRR